MPQAGKLETTIASFEDRQRLPRLCQPQVILWCMAGVALIAGLDLAIDPSRLMRQIGDTDDATRLVQVRELMAGAPWLDTTLPRFGGAETLVSHWSRLVDLPIALLIKAFSLFVEPARAELAARFSWPLIVLTGVLALIARNVAARADRAAAATAVLLAVTSLSAMNQFVPGRIDHHNMMVLGAVGGALLLARSITGPRIGWAAGALLGLGTAVGYEALLLTVAILALANLMALVTGRGGDGVWRASVAFAGVLAGALVVTTPPTRLVIAHCDALSINLVVLAACAGAGSWAVMQPLRGASMVVRIAVLAAAGAAGLVLFVAVEPVCLKGPFGQVDAAAVPLWLETVLETQSLLWMMSSTPGPAVAAAIFIGVGAGAAAWLVTKERTDASLLLAAVTVVAVLLGAWQIKFLPYATLMAVVALTIVIGRLGALVPARSGLVRGIATIAASQITLLALAQPVLSAIGLDRPDKKAVMHEMSACIANAAVTPLSGLKPGRVVGDIDLGPFIVAQTRLDAVAAPYHRIGRAIADVYRVLYGPEGEAETRVRTLGGAYVAICPGLATGLVKPVPKTGLRADLLAGRVPKWLEPVALARPTPIKVWRVRN